MDTGNIFETEGIVLKSFEFKESSKIIRIFTKELGIISVVVQGAKRPKSKKHNLVSVYAKNLFVLKKLKNMYVLLDGDVLDLHLSIRKNIKSIYFFQLILDLINQNLPEGEVSFVLYNLTDRYSKLIFGQNLVRVLNSFLIKFVSIIGYEPCLNKCVKCGDDRFKNVEFSFDLGGIICQNCLNSFGYAIAREEHIYIYDLLYKKIKEIENKEYRIDENRILKYFIEYYEANTGLVFPKSYDIFKKLISII